MQRCPSVNTSMHNTCFLGTILSYFVKVRQELNTFLYFEKKRKEVAWLGFELRTSMLEVRSANHCTIDPS